jgi:hypothetical protein
MPPLRVRGDFAFDLDFDFDFDLAMAAVSVVAALSGQGAASQGARSGKH